jgi:hypothetical protein
MVSHRETSFAADMGYRSETVDGCPACLSSGVTKTGLSVSPTPDLALTTALRDVALPGFIAGGRGRMVAEVQLRLMVRPRWSDG